MTTHHDKPDGLSSSHRHIEVPTGHTQPACAPPYTAQQVQALLSRAACDEAGARAAVRADMCDCETLDYQHVYNFVSELRKLQKL